MTNKTAIIWFTTNLRVADNPSLHAAMQENKSIIAVYCLEPKQFANDRFGFKKTGKFRAKFLLESIANLQENLANYGIPLVVSQKAPDDTLLEICAKVSPSTLYHSKVFTAEELETLSTVRAALKDTLAFKSFYDQFLVDPEQLPYAINDLPSVFSTFRKKVEKLVTIKPVLDTVGFTNKKSTIESTVIPSLQDLGYSEFEQAAQTAFPYKGGETEALQRVAHYFFETKALGRYKYTRNGLIGLDYSSKLSTWLANGSISARTIYWKVKAYENEYGANSSTYWMVFELLWRDYFKHLALKHGKALFYKEGMQHRVYDWNADQEIIQNWIDGKTAEPFVNANMIELKQTGWMSNRGRQNVASYFSKTLGQDWRIGAAYFESMLLDYDVHSNYGNWQYVSGVGNDPRNRTFSIPKQQERYDPKKEYVNLWIPKTEER